MWLVVKIGISTLTHKGGHLNIRRVTELVSVLSKLASGAGTKFGTGGMKTENENCCSKNCNSGRN